METRISDFAATSLGIYWFWAHKALRSEKVLNPGNFSFHMRVSNDSLYISASKFTLNKQLGFGRYLAN